MNWIARNGPWILLAAVALLLAGAVLAAQLASAEPVSTTVDVDDAPERGEASSERALTACHGVTLTGADPVPAALRGGGR